MGTKKNFNNGLVTGIALFGFAAVMILLTPFQVEEDFTAMALPNRFFPYVVFASIGLLSLLMIYRGWKELKDKQDIERNSVSWRDLLILLMGSVFILLTAETIGFTFASILVLAAIFYALGIRSFSKIALPSAIVPVVIDLIYRKILYVYLPLGIWEDLFR